MPRAFFPHAALLLLFLESVPAALAQGEPSAPPCGEVHREAHAFVQAHVPVLLAQQPGAPDPLAPHYAGLSREAQALAERALRCLDSEPDFGELHEVLEQAHRLLELLASPATELPRLAALKRERELEALALRYEDLMNGGARRYRRGPGRISS